MSHLWPCTSSSRSVCVIVVMRNTKYHLHLYCYSYNIYIYIFTINSFTINNCTTIITIIIAHLKLEDKTKKPQTITWIYMNKKHVFLLLTLSKSVGNENFLSVIVRITNGHIFPLCGPQTSCRSHILDYLTLMGIYITNTKRVSFLGTEEPV